MYGYTAQQVALAKEVLITYPWFGTLSLQVRKVANGYVEGLVWDSTMAGSPYYPDDYRGEYQYMNFPVTCVRWVLR
jgi:hypothetical protein